ncbi:HAD-IIIA family hydrolase [Priestia flexa]|uniref:KdsC family phosphatase n=1 Tax=Priestia flexa TaxID=86664 RepID=UPI001F30886C|nr:HAD-IIIA family hydrolase [Priestia flexa]UIR30981.1 HAD-IIIA family hydrolase [Priestia flexa]
MKKIKLIVLDVDGVMTDGSLYLGTNNLEYKRFNAQDGMGITLAHYAGIKTAIITGRQSESVAMRSKELKISYVFQGISNKLEVLANLVEEINIKMEEVCYMGDDINDIPILNCVGISCAPSNAVDIVKSSVDFVTQKTGGNGAVREMIEKVLSNETNLEKLINDFLFNDQKVIQ